MARNSIAQKADSQLQLEVNVPACSRPVPNGKAEGTRLVLFRPQLHRSFCCPAVNTVRIQRTCNIAL